MCPSSDVHPLAQFSTVLNQLGARPPVVASLARSSSAELSGLKVGRLSIAEDSGLASVRNVDGADVGNGIEKLCMGSGVTFSSSRIGSLEHDLPWL